MPTEKTIPEYITGKDGRIIKTSKWTNKTKTFYLELNDALEKHFGIKLDEFLTSGDRTSEEDIAVGGKGTGRHTKGEAIDIAINPVIHEYLWNTEEGLDMIERAGFGMLDKTHGTGPHYHLGADISTEEAIKAGKGIKKASQRRKELQTEGSETATYLTPEDIIALQPGYVDPEKIKKQTIEESLTPGQKSLRDRSEGYNQKLKKYQDAQKNYQATTEKDNVKVSEINQARKEYKDAYIDIYNEGQSINYDLNKEIYEKAKKDLDPENGFAPGTKRHRQAQMEVEFYEKGAGIVGRDLSPIFDLKTKKPLKVTKKPTELSKEFDKLTKDSWFFRDILNTRVLNDVNKKAEFINQELKDKIGQELEYEPEVQEKIAKEIEKRTALQRDSKIKKQTIDDIDQGILAKKIREDSEKTELEKQAKIQEELIKQENEKQALEDAKQTLEDAKKLTEYDQQASDYFSRFNEPAELIKPDSIGYDPANYKKQLPWEAIGYGALALSGLSDSKTESPLRDEEVSRSILQYTADLKRLSEQGLKPEEEAKMKDQLAGAYTSGLNQLVRASGGNRNVVLGNLGALNNARMRGITDMALTDIAIKQQNFEKYGNMIKEIQTFRTNKEIANHQIKLDDAREKRQGGAALASSGFASMLEELQYQKENGPGSANHRMNKTFEIMLTGIDSELYDPGDGSVKHTKSWADANEYQATVLNQQANESWKKTQSIRDSWEALSPEEKRNSGGIYKYIESLDKPSKPTSSGYDAGNEWQI